MRPFLFVLLLAGCASTYAPPVHNATAISQEIAANPADILRAAKQVLVSDGMQITNSDDGAGVISTAPKEMRLTPKLADCGTTLGLDYLKDNRTSGKVGYGVVVAGHRVTVTASMSATYLPSDVTQSITLTCVSKGVLEANLLAAIAAAVPK